MRTEELLFGDDYEHIIIAPHPDDELIGCYGILQRAERVLVVLPSWATTCARGKETEAVLQKTGVLGKRHTLCFGLSAIIGKRFPTVPVVWLPDPNYETHPQHKEAFSTYSKYINGGSCLFMDTSTIFGLYSTQMNTPYLHELRPSASKQKEELATLYKSQKGYFKQHNDSFFFEGRILL